MIAKLSSTLGLTLLFIIVHKTETKAKAAAKQESRETRTSVVTTRKKMKISPKTIAFLSILLGLARLNEVCFSLHRYFVV